MQNQERYEKGWELLKLLGEHYGVPVTDRDTDDPDEQSEAVSSAIQDALIDLRHACDLKNKDFAELDTYAQRHYVDEVFGG